jgi:hypothetical protein
MTKGFSAAVIAALLGVALYFLFGSDKAPVPPPALSSPVSFASQAARLSTAHPSNSPSSSPILPTVTASQTQSEPASLADKAGQYIPEATPDAPLAPETVLQNVQRAIHQYGEMFGGNPVGTNPEIAGQLSGNNPKHLNFITAEAGMHLNEDGALVDSWGTPYFFHQVSGAEMEIHSAGPDKMMWTADDLVSK